jgi:hypothetical protein
MSHPPSDAARKCDAAQYYILKILNMQMALTFKITMFQIYLELNINPIKPSTALPKLVSLSL